MYNEILVGPIFLTDDVIYNTGST